MARACLQCSVPLSLSHPPTLSSFLLTVLCFVPSNRTKEGENMTALNAEDNKRWHFNVYFPYARHPLVFHRKRGGKHAQEKKV